MSVHADVGAEEVGIFPKSGSTNRRGARKPRRPGRPRKLDHDAIASGAIGIVDREGVNALTMSSIASELGVAPMTLYTYVPTKDDLIGLMIDAILGDASPAASPEDPRQWREALLDAFVEIHDVISAHPNVIASFGTDFALGRRAARWLEATLNVLLSAGFDSGQAASIYRSLAVYALGDTHLRSSHIRNLEVLVHQAALSEGQHLPVLTRVAVELRDQPSREEFVWGLRKILDSIPDPGASGSEAPAALRAEGAARQDASTPPNSLIEASPGSVAMVPVGDEDPSWAACELPPGVPGSALKLVHDSRVAHGSDGAAIAAVATQLNVPAELLRSWAVRAGIEAAQSEGSDKATSIELRRLRNENQELRRVNEILKNASAYFAAQLNDTASVR